MNKPLIVFALLIVTIPVSFVFLWLAAYTIYRMFYCKKKVEAPVYDDVNEYDDKQLGNALSQRFHAKQQDTPPTNIIINGQSLQFKRDYKKE